MNAAVRTMRKNTEKVVLSKCDFAIFEAKKAIPEGHRQATVSEVAVMYRNDPSFRKEIREENGWVIVDKKGLGREGDMEILEDGSLVNMDRNKADSLPPERHAKYYKGAGQAIVCCSDYAGKFMSFDISTDHDSSGKFRVAYVRDVNAPQSKAVKAAARSR
ncbi:MAG: hypothetical protein M1520_01845 [Candidatus Marsarchaeota archaeon]|nr:hypothetical protein [Candidatus Marsarchaeota archaeon]